MFLKRCRCDRYFQQQKNVIGGRFYVMEKKLIIKNDERINELF